MNGFVLRVKDTWLRLPFNRFEVRLKGDEKDLKLMSGWIL